jgi:hypothetical protein
LEEHNIDKPEINLYAAELANIASMSLPDAAALYTRMGLRPTPLSGKTPTLKNWPNLRLTEEELAHHFFEGRNVGLLLGGQSGLVDIDLDNPEAIAAAGRILPPTLTSGREKNPHSHHWFVSNPAPASKTYSVPKPMAERLGLAPGQGTLVELRSTGRQTVVAPSVHPDDGDHCVWHGGEIREIDGEELAGLVAEVAVAALLALTWPPVGSRQRFALAAAGYLGRRLDPGRVEAVVDAAALAAGDEEREKRVEAARDTLAKLHRKEH